MARDADHHRGVLAAAHAVRDDPWTVVRQAGALARAKLRIADRDLGLNPGLGETTPDGRSAIVQIAQGQPYPAFDRRGKRRRGAFDTPQAMAHTVVRRTLEACEGPVRTGLDPACGAGAFVLAMWEAGVREVYGSDLDPVALDVAQVACPAARLVVDDALNHGPEVDVLCGNPPYVPPERQDKELRASLRRRFPWLHGRFDLVVPFAAVAADRVREGGAFGLVLPSATLVQPYGKVLRERWVRRHRFTSLEGPLRFPGASVDVSLVVAVARRGPAPLPDHGMPAEQLLLLPTVPLDPHLRPGDSEIVAIVRANSEPLSTYCRVDTGLVAHGPAGGKERLIFDEPGEGRVPYADARQFFEGTHRWIDYQPESMHRAKSPELFEGPKIVIQRLRGRGPVRAAVDRTGVYVGHTCTVVVPHRGDVDLDRLLTLVTDPVIAGVTRIERGPRLDLYPRDVGAIPVPNGWLQSELDVEVGPCLGLGPDQVARLRALTR